MGTTGGQDEDSGRATYFTWDVEGEEGINMSRFSSGAKWRTVLSAVAALGMTLACSAHADTITFNPTGGVTTAGGFNPGPSSITSLNWGSGDALAVGGVTAINNFLAGSGDTTFQLYYQTRLIGLNTSSGGTTPAGLNAPNGYQITEVTSFTEQVQSVGNGTATFSTAPGQRGPSQLSIYFTDLAKPGAVAADANTGAGFIPPASAGSLIYSASASTSASNYTNTTLAPPPVGGKPTVPLNPLTPGNYSGVFTDQGTGSTTLNTSRLTQDTGFFVTPGLILSQFSSNLVNPFADIGASLRFNDPTAALGSSPTVTPIVGSINGSSGPDFLFEVSGATQNFAVPEPASLSMALTGLGIVPLAVWQVRRRRAKA